MNRSSIVALVIGAMLFGCGVGMVAHEVMEPEEAVAYEGQKWEYWHTRMPTKAMSLSKQDTLRQEWLDEKGDLGWELVQMNMEGGNLCILKRPLN
jgi:hypothetical protein